MTKKAAQQKETKAEVTNCHACQKEFPKAELELVKNLYTCKACLSSGDERPDQKDKPEEEVPKEEEFEFCKDAEDRLDGMLAITKYAKRSESTILSYSRTRDFPIKKLPCGSIWMSSKSAIDKWWDSELAKA